MIRPLLLAAALWGTAAPAQEAAAAAPADAVPTDAGVPTEAAPDAPPDPVAAWQADPAAIIPAAGVDLEAFEYIARPLVVFSDSPANPLFQEQMRLIESDLPSLVTRDVAVIVDADPEAGSAVRTALRPRGGFGVVLLDKDGRVGLRRPSPETVREISRAIDRMPLRQEEIRYRGAGEG